MDVFNAAQNGSATIDQKIIDAKFNYNHAEESHGETVGERGMHESRMESAILQEKVRPFRKSFLKLYACILVGYLCSATNGFDGNTFGRALEAGSIVPR